MENGAQRAVGVELNGHVWDGSNWVPIPPQQPAGRQAGSAPAPGGRHAAPSVGSATPPLHLWQQRVPQPGGYTDPHYGYGFTRQTSDDLQFIARFVKIMIIVKIVLFVVATLVFIMTMSSLFAALGALLSRVPR